MAALLCCWRGGEQGTHFLSGQIERVRRISPKCVGATFVTRYYGGYIKTSVYTIIFLASLYVRNVLKIKHNSLPHCVYAALAAPELLFYYECGPASSWLN